MKKLSLFACIVVTLTSLILSGCGLESSRTSNGGMVNTNASTATSVEEINANEFEEGQKKAKEINTNKPGGPRKAAEEGEGKETKGTKGINTNNPGGPRSKNTKP